MPERSAGMKQTFTLLDTLIEELDLAVTPNSNTNHVHNSIEKIGKIGGEIGYLYATCCTQIRKPLYQKMFKEMNNAHTKLWQCIGHSH